MSKDTNQSKQSLIHDVIPRSFYVVSNSYQIEGNWEQLSNPFEKYEDAVRYRDSSFIKKENPNAFIVSTLNEV
jgi:hypothetical protein